LIGMSAPLHCLPEPDLIAYQINPSPMRIAAAPATRAWMGATGQHFAYRCLPLLIANQSGWFILNSHPFRATWTGEAEIASLRVEYLDGTPPVPAISHFGYGLLTWSLSYLFRTSPGYNLLVRGPANWPKDGACPLEGVVETDWSVATFTMNWKLTRPNHPVTFERDEPFCMIVPQRRGELESFKTDVRGTEADPDLHERYAHWRDGRARFLSELRVPGSAAAAQRWEKHYFQGKSPDARAAPEHQTKLALREFDEPERTER
jgi:hypothetical protein